MNPRQTCATCDRSRDCLLHLRSEFPPDAARRHLRRTCETPDQCVIEYRAGIA